MIMKKREKYNPPVKLKEWINDINDGELYGAYVSSDQKVWCTSGRFAHSSGASNTSWAGFMSGELNDLIIKTMGQAVLNEMIIYIKRQKNNESLKLSY